MKDLVIILDCGATNVRVIAMDQHGHIEASQTYPNNVSQDPHHPGGLIWDVNEIWQKLTRASKEVMAKVKGQNIAGVSVTTFGVDGAFINQEGTLTYPVISWQCERTHPVMEQIDQYINKEKLYQICGVYPYGMNTINKILWLKKNRPEAIDHASDFLFISSLFMYKLCGERVTDCTMAGTSMLMDARTRKLSNEILNSIGIDGSLFPGLAEAGDVVGSTTREAENTTGIPQGTKVFVAGHDTQFAIFGSGASLGEAVLSSGTWEILMSRSRNITSENKQLNLGITTELDAVPGVYNIGLNWIGSGPLEWIRKMFYSNGLQEIDYDVIIKEAEALPPGSNGIRFNPDFVQEEKGKFPSGIFGLRLNTSRAEIYRAGIEALSYKLKNGIEALEQAGGVEISKVICVGGGSKNKLWNQLRADVTNKNIQLIDQKETTVLGAALFGFVAAGIYKDVEEARNHVDYKPEIIAPSANHSVYDQLSDSYYKYISG